MPPSRASRSGAASEPLKALPYPSGLRRQGATRGPGGRAVTPFQFRVYDALLLIPEGQVTTYKHLAAHLGSHPRAVGQALRCNPYAPQVPCHRVVAADFALGGFCGQTQGAKVAEKQQQLEREGIVFVGNAVSPALRSTCLFTFC